MHTHIYKYIYFQKRILEKGILGPTYLLKLNCIHTFAFRNKFFLFYLIIYSNKIRKNSFVNVSENDYQEKCCFKKC